MTKSISAIHELFIVPHNIVFRETFPRGDFFCEKKLLRRNIFGGIFSAMKVAFKLALGHALIDSYIFRVVSNVH
jgi:hypothetical protein